MLSSKSTNLVKLFQNLNLSILNLRPIQTTSILNAEPLKKKKRTEASIIQLRVERKRKKLQRIIEQLEAQEKIKIPLFEYTIDKHILKNLDERTRKNEEKLIEIKNELERLNVVWTLYKGLENRFDNLNLRRVLKNKLNTLKELKNVSVELYEDALQLDEKLFPFKDEHIIKETVLNKDYQPDDGQIVNCTKAWKIELATVEGLLKK